MPSIEVRTQTGATSGSVELDAAIFGIEPNIPVMHQVVVAQLAAARAGTQSTKTRAEVAGGGAKPYRQKGTGRARQGSIRSPQFVGGGVAHAPKPRSYRKKVNKKVVSLALRSALSDRATEGRVVVVDRWDFDTPSTKSAVTALGSLGVDGKVLVVYGDGDENAVKSFRNLTHVQLMSAGELNTYDVLNNDWVVFTADTLPAPGSDATEAPADVDDPEEETDEVDAATEAPAAVEEAEESSSPAPYGEGSHAAIEDDAMPDGYPIKGNTDSMKYHTSESPWYGRTVAEVWFADEASAEAAGFVPGYTPRADDDSTDDPQSAGE